MPRRKPDEPRRPMLGDLVAYAEPKPFYVKYDLPLVVRAAVVIRLESDAQVDLGVFLPRHGDTVAYRENVPYSATPTHGHWSWRGDVGEVPGA